MPRLIVDVVDEALHQAAERFVGRVFLQELRRGVAQLLELVAIGGLDERFARREVPVERADPDLRRFRDAVERRVRVLGERGDRDGEQPLAIPLRVLAQPRLGSLGARHGDEVSSIVGAKHDGLANRRMLRLFLTLTGGSSPSNSSDSTPRSDMRITTPFTANSTAADVIQGIDLGGKRAIVTGGASGIGVETARALASAGADVVLAVRDVAAGERVAADIARTTKNPRVTVSPLDLSVRDSVNAFVNALARAAAHPRQQRRRHGVAADAHGGGVGDAVRDESPRPLRARARPRAGAARGGRCARRRRSARPRICAPAWTSTTSISFAAPTSRGRRTDNRRRANVLFAVEATKRWSDYGITVNALMPGAIRTALQRHVTEEELDRLRAQSGAAAPTWKTPEQGAATSVLLATSPLLDGSQWTLFRGL